MIAIETKYIGPSNYRGSRMVATTCNGHRLVIGYNETEVPGDVHARCNEFGGSPINRYAAEQLASKMGWLERGAILIGGGTKAGEAFCFHVPRRA